jgi:uncharacterized protein YjaG (DUF416 family)
MDYQEEITDNRSEAIKFVDNILSNNEVSEPLRLILNTVLSLSTGDNLELVLKTNQNNNFKLTLSKVQRALGVLEDFNYCGDDASLVKRIDNCRSHSNFVHILLKRVSDELGIECNNYPLYELLDRLIESYKEVIEFEKQIHRIRSIIPNTPQTTSLELLTSLINVSIELRDKALPMTDTSISNNATVLVEGGSIIIQKGDTIVVQENLKDPTDEKIQL